MRFWRKGSRVRDAGLSPDEIFLDAENIAGFDQERFEGVIEKPLERGSFYVFGALVFLAGSLLFGRAAWLGIARGEEFEKRAEGNYIRRTYYDAPRGLIYDRKGTVIVSNTSILSTSTPDQPKYARVVKHPYAFSHVVGFLGKPTEEELHDPSFVEGLSQIGKSGLEKFYEERLHGVPGERDEELDARGEAISRGPLIPPQEGNDLHLTIDADLQEALWERLQKTVDERGFRGGAGIVFSIKDGSILALTSVPSFDANAFADGLSHEEARAMFDNPAAPLFNRAISGLYTPGSIIKPFIAIAALEEQVIDPNRSIYSSGQLVLPNPFGGPPSIFRDWKAHGYVDMREAIAVSSDEYFYTVGGGYGDIKGLGIGRIKTWLDRFQFNKPTGIDLFGEDAGYVPDADSKAEKHPDNPIWRIGDTYHVSIGQGDLLITPISMMRSLGVLATRGSVLTPHLLKEDVPHASSLDHAIAAANYEIIAEGMNKATHPGGTAQALSWLPFEAAGKTGTAEIGNKERVNSWFIGYAPYEDPQIGMVLFLESGHRTNLVGAPAVASEMFRWILDHGGIAPLVN